LFGYPSFYVIKVACEKKGKKKGFIIPEGKKKKGAELSLTTQLLLMNIYICSSTPGEEERKRGNCWKGGGTWLT